MNPRQMMAQEALRNSRMRAAHDVSVRIFSSLVERRAAIACDEGVDAMLDDDILRKYAGTAARAAAIYEEEMMAAHDRAGRAQDAVVKQESIHVVDANGSPVAEEDIASAARAAAEAAHKVDAARFLGTENQRDEGPEVVLAPAAVLVKGSDT